MHSFNSTVVASPTSARIPTRRLQRLMLATGLSFGALSFGTALAGTASASLSTGVITTIAGNGTSGSIGDGSAATSAEIDQPQGVGQDSAGDLVIADTVGYRIRFVPATTGLYFGRTMNAGDIYTIAGNGTAGYSGNYGPGISAQLMAPSGVALDQNGDVLIADRDTNTVRIVANSDESAFNIAMHAGDIYTIAGNPIAGYSGDGGPAAASQLHSPDAVAVDANGIAISDQLNNVVRFVATSSGNFFGIAMNAGNIYTIVGTGTSGYNGDGRPATSAELANPISVAFDALGDLAIADNVNNRIRFVPATSASYFSQTMVANDIYTVAGSGSFGYTGDGGPAQTAELNAPLGVAFDGLDDLGIADSFNHVVRFVPAASGAYFGETMHVGDIYTIAGNGSYGTSGDNNLATSAELTYPYGIAFTHNDSLMFADNFADRVRMVESGWSSPDVTSATSAGATVGQPFSFSVTTSGDPTPYVQLTGTLPAGLSFVAHNDGTATITGTPSSAGTATVFLGVSNGVEPAPSEPLTITVLPAPTKNGPLTPTHCLTTGLNPKHVMAKTGRALVIRGCDPTAALLKVGVTLLQPHVRSLTSSLRLNGAGAFSYETPKLAKGATIIVFKVGGHTLFATNVTVR